MPIFGQNNSVICDPYFTDILLWTQVANTCPKLCKALRNHHSVKIHFIDNMLSKRTIILLNLEEFPLILANSGYDLISWVSGGILHYFTE